MDQLPNWLTDAISAAGMTAYADELYPKAGKETGLQAPSIPSESPLH